MELNIFPVIGLGVIAAILAVVLRQYRPEYAMLVSLAAGVFILARVAGEVTPVVAQIRAITQEAALPAEYVAVLFKALGICFLTQIACDTCKDAGESAISAKVELAGKVAVLVVSLPLFAQVLTVVRALLQ